MRKTNLTYNSLIEDIRSNGAFFLLDAGSNQEGSSLAGFFGHTNFSNNSGMPAPQREYSNPFSGFQQQHRENTSATTSTNNNAIPSNSSSSSSSYLKNENPTRLDGGRVTASSFLDFLENSQQQHMNGDQPFSLPSFSFLKTETMDHSTGGNNNKPSNTEEVNFANTLKSIKQEQKENLGFQNFEKEAKFLSPPQKSLGVPSSTSSDTASPGLKSPVLAKSIRHL